MVLQKIIFPGENSFEEQTLFFRGNKPGGFPDLMKIDSGGKVSFDTYYNLFSVEKWKRYTMLSDLSISMEVEGKFLLEVFAVRLLGKRIVREKIDCFIVEADKKSLYHFPIKMSLIKGNCYFEMHCEKPVILYSAAWVTEQVAARQIHFAIDMCTLKKQEYVQKNVELLKREIFLNESSALYGRVKLFLVDNENSDIYLPYISEDIYVFQNRNLGGSGGFARGMVEVLKANRDFPATHVILMDDDVFIQVSALERTYAFLCFLKKEYQYAFVGGSILQMGKEYIQSEYGGRFRFTGGFGMHSNADLRNLQKVLENDCGRLPEYIPWCYCCIPLECIRSGLPMPLFLHHDDVEYGMRVSSSCICMNGIAISHKPNQKKRPSPNAYYNVRNLLAVICLHKKYMPKILIKMYVVMKVMINLILARYKDAYLNIEGVQDYLKGPEWLAAQNCEKKHEEICKRGYHYEAQDIEDEAAQNGYRAFRIGEPVWKVFFCRKLCYINDENKSFLAEKNKEEERQVIKQLFQILHRLGREYRRVQKEYQDRVADMTTFDFWERYLKQVK